MIKLVGATWHCDFRTSSGKRIRQSLNTGDRREAKDRETRLIREAEEKIQRREAGGMTLKEAFKHALRVRESWRSAKSIHSIHQIYGMVEKNFGEDTPLSELDDEVLLEYGEELFDNGLTPSTINKRFSLVAVLFDEAIQWKKYHGRKPNTVRYKVRNGRKRLISPKEEGEVISILRASKSPWEQAMADLITVLADTGLRLSEGLNIRSQDVNLQHRTLMVPESKNDEARVVPLTERAFQVLMDRSENSPVFDPLTRSTASHIWRRVRAKMGLEHEREFVIHAFRHTFGSTLADAGMDAFRIQKVMGHKVIATTQKYVKVSSSALSDVSEIMQSRYDQKLDQRGSQKGLKEASTLGERLRESTT